MSTTSTPTVPPEAVTHDARCAECAARMEAMVIDLARRSGMTEAAVRLRWAVEL